MKTICVLMGLVALLAFCSSASAYVYVNSGGQVLPGEKPQVEVCSWDEGSVAVSVYEVDVGSIYEFMATQEESVMASALSSTPIYEKTLRMMDRCEELELPVLDKGAYAIFAKGKEENATEMFFVSELGLVSKGGDEETLIYALNVDDGHPIKGVELKIYDEEGRPTSGVTDSEGIYKIQSEDDLNIIGSIGEDIAILSPYFYSWREKAKIYVYTDRPVYRPNHEVYYKAVIWENTKEGFQVASGKADIEINDAKGNLVYEETLDINEFGSVSGKFTLGDEPPLGYYYIQVSVGEDIQGGGNFQVEEYRKPEYEVTVTPLKEDYIRGDEVTFEIDASYYFGSPVADAEVQYTITKSGWYYPCKGYWCYYVERDYYYYGYGDYVQDGTGRTDGNGKLEVSFIADNDRNAVYSVEARVVDKSRREVMGYGSVVVARGEFDFSVQTSGYSYTKGDNVRITIRSNDLDENPISAYGELKIERTIWQRGIGQKTTLMYEEDFETSSAGEAFVDFVPDMGGSFKITVTGKDSRGNEITADEYFYVRDEKPTWDYWEYLEVILDKEAYEEGDVAKVTINSPVEDFTAFVTVEGDEVYDYYIQRFEGTSGTLEIPIRDVYAPNAQVYVMVVKELTQYTSSEYMVVPPVEKFLDVQIISDKEEYLPRDQATFEIITKDRQGNPVSAELSLGVVDESIYAIAEEAIQDIEEFFYGRRWSRVRTDISWRGWGRGIYGMEEALEAPTAMAFDGDMESAKMAGGLVEPQTRRYFPDTAFWHAHVRTDASGRATVKVTMPDSLTTWRATARAVDKSFRVGQQTDKVIARKNLLVRLETPRFLTQKDELVISAVVHNYLGTMKDVVVELEANGVELLDDAERTVSVAHGGDERVDWRIKVEGCCVANFTVKALTDVESDAMELVLPIIPYGVEEYDVWAGSVEDSLTTNVLVPEDSVYGATELSVMVSPSIAATAFDALEYLASYPYGCVEQTMSSFLPDVYVAQVLRDLGIKNEKLEEELPEMVNEGLQKLYNMQHGDGGWGWWENDDTNPYMTAYVVYGLTQAQRADFTVDENVLRRGLESLKNQYKEDKEDANTKAYMAYALSFHETPPTYPDDSKLSDYGIALKTLAKINRGDKSGFPSSLKDSAICDEIVCHWSSETFKYEWRSNDVETTAYVLMALIKTEPQSEMVEKAVRWLVTKRQGRRWHSTKDTAIAVFSLAEYLKISKELSPNYVANIYLNGKLVESVKKDDVFDMDNEIRLDPVVGKNEVRIEKDGQGKLYYSIVLRYFREEEPIKAKSSGIMVEKSYNVTSVKSGEYIEVKLTVDVPNDVEYVILEDPLPAGCEVVEEVGYRSYYWDWGWDYWYSRREVRDEKVVYFMTWLHPGKNEIKYTIRAEIPGSYRVMPATAWNMYQEEIRGHSAEVRLDIVDKVVVRLSDVSIDEDSVDFTVDALKMVEGDLSGEILIELKDMGGNVLREVREYVSIRESVNSQEVSIPISLEDGIYMIYYTITTSDGDELVGTKRIQVGEVEVTPVEPVEPTEPTKPKPAEGDGNFWVIVVILAIVIAGLGLGMLKKKPKKKAKKAKKSEE